jgi:hypothetical protein
MYSHAWSIAFTKDEIMLQANSFHLFQTCWEWVQGNLLIVTRPKMANKSNNPSDGVAPGSWSLPTLLVDVCNKCIILPFSVVLTGSKPILKSHPNTSLTEPAQRRVRLGPLQLRNPVACVMQTVADSLEFWLRAIFS